MREAQERNERGIPVPDRSWKLADWLDYWLEHVVLPKRRPATYRLYEMTVRLYLKPGLGPSPLARLSASACRPSSTAISRQAGRSGLCR
jgi:Phage integrase, N-terminal SAM-like domain